MPEFIFTYRSAKGRDATADPNELAAWASFLNDLIAPRVVDPATAPPRGSDGVPPSTGARADRR